MTFSVKELSRDERAVIERLLGRRVLEQESISVRAFEQPVLSEEKKRELADQLKNYFAEVDAHRMPGTTQEAEEVINEAIRSVRPGYRDISENCT